MSKKLAGVTLIYKGQSQDYCFKESIKSLLEFCDSVYITYVQAEIEDGTHSKLMRIIAENPDRIVLILVTEQKWNSIKGKYKLSELTNYAIESAEKDGYEYIYSQQADEVTHEKSYPSIRQALEKGEEAYAISRINLWGSPYTKLIVAQERKPCSTTIVRLAKSKYRAYDDAESLAAIASMEFHDQIRMYHMGFTRKREVMVDKIKHMQQQVFGMADYDQKLNGMTIFEPYKWFDKETDLALIDEPLPEIIKEWAAARVYND